eukprot:2440732-Amphidinium_carterae.1
MFVLFLILGPSSPIGVAEEIVEVVLVWLEVLLLWSEGATMALPCSQYSSLHTATTATPHDLETQFLATSDMY